jgi:Glycosyl transferase family 11
VKTVKVQGGIGNQLFGLAFTHSVARLTGEPVAIDLAAFGSDRYGHVFDVEDLALRLGAVRIVHRPLLAGRLTTALMRVAPLPGYVSEGAPPTDGAGLAGLIARGRYFSGYWQNEAYFALPEEFVALTREAVFRRVEAPPRRDLVIHYRTYREEIRRRARRTPGADYVRDALARIEARLGRATDVALVSDDPALALRTLGDVGREFTTVTGAGPWDDLALLMNARALVLTNSSFSWWGGFCGQAEMAIYPRADGFFHYPIPAARFACV